ncbi:hypothetical protein JYK02_26430 [Corallococcus macrosporus]|uniref:Lipoprotein n=1 Tax=Corallococcus macrosporus TaxID=35 RepID=A0ABS3DIB0_9BACT|nr:hypothetical protein [Corallococcus macrosporus]MBN8231062.1 hypothetical protein [Corallococcus macrosporus]
MKTGEGFKGFTWVLTTLAMALTSTGCGEEDVADSNDWNPHTVLTAASTSDAGTSIDAGWDLDAGPCETTPYDPKLGTLQLQPGFVAGESVPLPAAAGVVGVTPGPTYSLYTLVSENYHGPHALYSLGTWPLLSLGSAPLLDMSPSGLPNYSSYFVQTDGQHVITGVNFPGTVGVYDIAAPSASTSIPLTTLTAAAVVPGAFLLTTRPLGNPPGGAGETETLVALRTDTSPLTQTTVATFPAESQRSASVSVATHGALMVSYYEASSFIKARLVAPATVAQALTSGVPFSLADAPVMNVGSRFNRIAGHGAGMSVLRGSIPAPGFPYTDSDVSRFPITVTNNGATVTVGSRQPIVVFPDRCTQVTGMNAIGPDLLLRVQDKNGTRLVRIQQAP